MANNVQITSKAIQKILHNYNASASIAEYIWNGFDAKAKIININYECNALGTLNNFEIIDDGGGINFEKLTEKFHPFHDSEKAIELNNPKHTSIMHGRNGVGRLTFFTFANSAEWVTTFKKNDTLISGRILINTNGLNTFKESLLENNVSNNTGTRVSFADIKFSIQEFEKKILPFLVSEFCWFLELNKEKKIAILINGKPLDYSLNIEDYEKEKILIYNENGTIFKFNYVQWKETLHKEFSKFYFINSHGDEVFKDFTTFNNRGDQFYNSVYIKSSFFDDFDFNSSESDTQKRLLGKSKSSPEYKFFIKEINTFLRAKRKPFLRDYAFKLVEQFEQDGILPIYKDEWEQKFKKPQLEETLIGLYEVQPNLFTKLNTNQKKTFVRLLDLLLDSNERDNLIKILDEIIDLDTEEREDLVKLFKTTKLNRIIECIKLIKDRYKTFYQLRDLVYNPDLKANEVNHLQKVIESHYWIFGEQYHLVTAAEPKFEEALRRYIFHLTEKDTAPEIDHHHKLKEMDIFACRQNVLADRIENIVVELKHPLVTLGENQYSQVHKYLQVISSQPEFNAENMYWEFYLIGNKFNSSGYIDDLINTNKNHGIPFLILSKDNGRIKVYAKKWSEVFADFEIKHRHLDEKLKLERIQLTNELINADEIVKSTQNNSAIQPKEVLIN